MKAALGRIISRFHSKTPLPLACMEEDRPSACHDAPANFMIVLPLGLLHLHIDEYQGRAEIRPVMFAQVMVV